MKKYEVVVGIDFGSSGSGFAYSYFDKNKIIHGEIYGASVDHKVPTEIILDDQNYTIQFGAECVNFLKSKGLKVGHYFKGIKMHLYENKNTIISNNSGKELPLKLVIQKVLEEIKKIAIKEISKNRPHLEKETEKIKWVVTVPAIWNEHQKGVMMESCIGAGLVNDNTDKSLFFALEPEAASLYCSINKEIDRQYFIKGEYYIVCDLGGGTGDIVAHLVGNNNNLNEISPSCGGNFGSNEIDKSIFKDVILKLFGCKDFNTFYLKFNKKHKKKEGDDDGMDKAALFNDWCEFEREIKDFKEGATINKIENNETFPINCSLFQDIFDDDVNINQFVKEYNDTVNDSTLTLSVRNVSRRWIIEFPYGLIFSYMETQANSICEIINKINSDGQIKYLIFVGGYCSNEILVNLIKNRLKHIKIFLQPSNPSLAVMEGAVLFGIEPSTINIRKAKYTIGERLSIKWNDKLHSGRGTKFYDEDVKAWFCADCFVKYIEINKSLNFGETITRESYYNKKAQNIPMEFYITKKKDPSFIFEEGVKKVGEYRLDLGEQYKNLEDRKIITTMKFGGTFIDVAANHLKSGKSVKTKLNFD